MNAVFPVGSDRLLVRYESLQPDGWDTYRYVMIDTAGRTLGISRMTRANVVATRGDSVFWVGRAPAGEYFLGVSVAPR
jgi:hypothetical protein